MYTINDLKDPRFPTTTAIFYIDETIGKIPVPKKDQDKRKQPKLNFPGIQFVPSDDVISVPRRLLKEWTHSDAAPGSAEIVDVYLNYFLGQPRRVKDPATGEMKLEGTYGDIILKRGILRVKPNEKNLYKYLFYCNFNSKNEFRNPDKMKIFFEYKEHIALLSADEKRRKINYALHLAYTQLSDEEAVGYATSLGIVTHEIDINVVRAKLAERAEEDPMVFIDGAFKDFSLKAIVEESIQFGLIEYVHETGDWNLIIGTNQRELLHRVIRGNNHMESFMTFLTKDWRGQDTRKLIEGKLRNMKGLPEKVEKAMSSVRPITASPASVTTPATPAIKKNPPQRKKAKMKAKAKQTPIPVVVEE